MLAKELKIANLIRQRNFIEKQLANQIYHPKEDGNTTYRYVGQVYREVIEYFILEGFNVERIDSDMLKAATNGLPIYLFTVSDEIVLSDEEMKVSEEIQQNDSEESDSNVDEDIEDLLKKLFR